MLRFESLANELLLEIFEYFDVFDLLRAFDGLNSRFNTLLYEHFRAYYLDLRRISSQDFNTLFRNRRVSIVDRIVSLRLGDRSETPEICNVSDAIFSQLKMVSSTLESLCIQNDIPHPLSDIADLYQKAPNLRVLSMNINLQNEYEKFPVVVTSIMTLKLDFCGELRALHKLFQNLPNLCHLTIDMRDHYLTGHEWKQIIIDHLP
ncbi:unnamed protein product [Adineta steineri]|uniref:F-box domain-containing protein n=1 Tax=Adineta steineri TaxID=433720 RepID=A0A819LV76_9BILA|nr:unnamed protein product [Adineta steineri]